MLKTRAFSAAASMALAAAAFAQPALFTDLGDKSAASNTGTTPVTLTAANNIQWFKVILPATSASVGFVDLWLNGPGDITDSLMGVYLNTGAVKASDDDDGPSLLSALSFGKTTPTRAATPFVAPATANGVAYNGRDGNLVAGIHWIAVGRFGVTFGGTNWTVTSTYTGTQRTTTLGWSIEVAALPLTVTPTVSPTIGLVGSTFNTFATVGLGTSPASTGVAVSVDASAVDAGTVALHDDGVAPDVTANDNIFSAAITVGPAATVGTKTLAYTATDAQARTANGSTTFRVAGAPATFTNLGDLSLASSLSSTPVTLTSATDIQWFKAKLPAVSATNGYVDLWTSTPGDITDSEIGVYSAAGAMVANDDDDAAGNLSALSFGQTAPTRPATGDGVAYNGRDGVLSNADYWIAVGRFNVTFNGTVWDVTSTSTSAERTTTLNWNIQLPGSPTNPSGVAANAPTHGLSGASFVTTCTVTPGTFPASTGITVSCDASNVGGGTVSLLDNGVAPDVTANDNVFTGTITTSATTGAKTLSYSIADAQARTGATNSTYTIDAPPPANDTCGSASSAVVGANPFNNSAATNDGLVACATSAKDVWFKFNTGALPGTASFDTCTGTSQDTVLSVYDGCGGAVIACNDDSCGLQSSISGLSLAANTNYYIRVASFGSSPTGGAGVLTVGFVAGTAPTGAGANVTMLPSSSGPITVTVTPGTGPASTGLTVTADTTSVGGGPGTVMYDDGATGGDVTANDNVFTATVTAPATDGAYNVPFTVADAQARSTSGSLTVNAFTPADWTEIGDADQVWGASGAPAAQIPVGMGPLSTIDGSIPVTDQADMYQIRICDFASFSATTNTAVTGTADTQLFLFDQVGNGVQMDDDGTAMGLRSAFANEFVTSNGVYYIAVSHYDVDPLNSTAAEIWADQPFGAVRLPDGVGAADPIAVTWTANTSSAFSYRIAMTGVCYSSCVADFNGDGQVDFNDYLDFVDALSQQTYAADFNADGQIDFNDYLDFVDALSLGCGA